MEESASSDDEDCVVIGSSEGSENVQDAGENADDQAKANFVGTMKNQSLQEVVHSKELAVVHSIKKADGSIVEGSFFNHFQYATFLSEWLHHVRHKTNTVTSSVPLANQERDMLKIDQNNLFHCMITVVGLPPTEFFGCGFGKTMRLAKWAACRELVIRLYSANLVTPVQFNRIGSTDLLSKTAKRKCRQQWSLVKSNMEHFLHIISLQNIPDWFLCGPYQGNEIGQQLIEHVRKAVDGCTESLRSLEDKANTEMRRKRKADDELTMSVVVSATDHVIKSLSLLDNETSNDSKRRRLAPPTTELESSVSADVAKKESVGEVEVKEITKNSELCPEDVPKSGTSQPNNVVEDADCAIIGEVKDPGLLEIITLAEDAENDDASKIVANDVPSTSNGTVHNEAPAALNSATTPNSADIISPSPIGSPAGNIKPEYLKMCQRLGVTHVPILQTIFDTIKEKRAKYPREFTEFDEHIWRHFRMNAQDDRTFTWKMRVRERLLHVVQRLYPVAKLIAVGSTINGCGAYNSDMDLCMCLPDHIHGYKTERDYGVRVLKKVYRELAFRCKDLVKMATLIPAKVPIIKLEMQYPFHELEVDINCNNVPGIYNSHLLHYYARIDDRFPALCLLVKHWAINAGINNAMTGTFNSYSLILLVLHFLQCAVLPPVLPNLQALFPDQFNGNCSLDTLELFRELRSLPEREVNTKTVGELLIAFFDYYSHFDFARNAISIHEGRLVPRSALPQSSRRFKLFIQEPFDFQNTARCVTRIENMQLIKLAFADARQAFLGVRSKAPSLINIDVE